MDKDNVGSGSVTESTVADIDEELKEAQGQVARLIEESDTCASSIEIIWGKQDDLFENNTIIDQFRIRI